MFPLSPGNNTSLSPIEIGCMFLGERYVKTLHLRRDFSRLWRLFFNGIISTIVPRMTTENTFQSQKTSTHHTIFLYRFVCIGTTRRIESAETFTKNSPQETMIQGKSLLIKTNDPESEVFKHTLSIILQISLSIFLLLGILKL